MSASSAIAVGKTPKLVKGRHWKVLSRARVLRRPSVRTSHADRRAGELLFRVVEGSLGKPMSDKAIAVSNGALVSRELSEEEWSPVHDGRFESPELFLSGPVPRLEVPMVPTRSTTFPVRARWASPSVTRKATPPTRRRPSAPAAPTRWPRRRRTGKWSATGPARSSAATASSRAETRLARAPDRRPHALSSSRSGEQRRQPAEGSESAWLARSRPDGGDRETDGGGGARASAQLTLPAVTGRTGSRRTTRRRLWPAHGLSRSFQPDRE